MDVERRYRIIDYILESSRQTSRFTIYDRKLNIDIAYAESQMMAEGLIKRLDRLDLLEEAFNTLVKQYGNKIGRSDAASRLYDLIMSDGDL